MKKFEEIVNLTHSDVERFNNLLSKQSYSDDQELNSILDYIFKKKGKQIRPILVYLAARIFGNVNDKTDQSAILVQLLHTATLLHDDVVDEAEMRRGRPTINAEYKNKVAILVGDYLFANALTIATRDKLYDILEILTPTISLLSIGEINQLEMAESGKFSEELYFKIIEKKTAVLISACCEAGAVSIGVSDVERETIRKVGLLAGLAFQIQDDILDFTSDGVFGKAKGKDLEEKKYTLPLIYALNHADKKEAKEITGLISKGVDKKDIKRIVSFIHQNGGIDYAKSVMKDKINEADNLLSTLPQNEANNRLSELINFFADRNK